MEVSRAAKAMKTRTTSKAMESRSVAHEAGGGRNAGRAKAMEACAGAAKIAIGRNAAALEAKGHGSAAGPQARLRRAAVMVRRVGIPRIAVKVPDGICVVRSRT